ncbi:ATP-binding protein [uncultured Roseobacter sp.]|uniref:ATP-binding protein n=1 Tax=uncultured Roseobacter sp. TaxID=114847 RepID=UPI002635F266|nr:ATP-binding protein [uncultured Roseobacter sp.]
MTNNILQFWQNAGDDPFEPLFEAAPILMHSIDDKGILLKVSRFWSSKLGYKTEEMVGRPSTDFLTEKSRKYALQTVLPEFYRKGSMANVEYVFVRKDGSPLPVLLSAIAEYDAEGNFERSLAVMFDNTEAKRAQAELVQSQRTDAIGRLVGGVAHDFNNLLTVVQGNLEFIKLDFDSEEREIFLTDAMNAVERGAALTQQLLTYGRKANLNPKLTNINRAIREMDSMLRRVLPSTTSIETVVAAGLWLVEIDRHLLDTAIINIVNNAQYSMPENGATLTVETCNVRISDEYISARHEDIQPGRYVMLAISDNGSGMTRDVAEQVFEPFFTTKPVGKGSGLGLSMVFGFIKQSSGAIRIYSEPGHGTTVKMYFPAVGAPDTPPADKPEYFDFEDDGNDIKILVVEDEPDVRKVLVRQLRGMGLRISQAESGDDAFKMIENGHRPDILLTDIVMPGTLQGPALAAEARAVIDGLRVIYVSGYPNEAAIHGNGVNQNDVQLVKPVDTKTLTNAVGKMIKLIDAQAGSGT